MTVAELIAHLAVYDQDLNVALAKDREGNGFSPLDELGHQPMMSLSKWELEYDFDGEDTVILWPMN